MVKLVNLVKTLRSKNAGPFLTTMDIFFEDRESYERVKNSGVITKELVAKLYGIPINDVVGLYYYDPAMGIKITIIKPHGWISGDPENTDVLGCSQHVPLQDIEIP